MRRPEPYEAVYHADRRKHQHRCRHCRRIIQPGERVLMWKETAKTSRAIHIEHADAIATPASQFHPALTWRELAQAHSDAFSRRLGHCIA